MARFKKLDDMTAEEMRCLIRDFAWGKINAEGPVEEVWDDMQPGDDYMRWLFDLCGGLNAVIAREDALYSGKEADHG